ncbi:S16 family serine protease [Prosthecobacter sp. SYSU 5D2]|uniref:S16 family serine protease n=1 Tax=Prosthecobacter sp. SYSU 5D2 TaxID=3134134 RepID=UPI0031FF21D7
MKTALWKPWKHLARCCALGTFLVHAGVSGQQLSTARLVFSDETHLVQASVTLPPGHYLGSGSVTVAPGEGNVCHFEVSPSTLIEGTRFVLQTGARLRVRGARLQNCQIQAEAGSEVLIESSVLENCDLGGSGSPQPSFRISNCILQGGGWTAAGNEFGLEMMDCLVREQTSPDRLLRMAVDAENSPVSLARRPSIRYTEFNRCLIHPTLLVAVSQVTIENCTAVFEPDLPLFNTPAETGPEVMLPVRWVNNNLLSLPNVGGGVAIQRVREPVAGGCTLTEEMQSAAAGPAGAPSPPPRSLAAALPSSGPALAGDVYPLAGTPLAYPMADGSAMLKLQQSHVNGLLVIHLPTGKTAGQMSRLSIMSMKGPMGVRFNQSVGSDMLFALREVRKFMERRHAYPPRLCLEISFEEKYAEKGGPSAAVACGLLMESLFTGKTWDPAFAVTGDMNADGSVQPIGGVAAKMRGATRKDCTLLAIPAKNENAVADILVLDGPAPLAAIHIFGLEQFDQAVSLASLERPAALQQALDEFEVFREAILRDPRQTANLHNPHAISRLQSVVEKAPHSLSARYLLAYAQRRAPQLLSLAGSVEFADSHALGLLSSMDNAMNGRLDTLKPDDLGADLNRLRRLRSVLDARVRPFIDALIDYGETVRTMVLNPVRTSAKFYGMLDQVQSAGRNVLAVKKKLASDPQVIEELRN